MKERCQRANNISFHNYGGRGIGICEPWQDFLTFSKWALANGWRSGLHLDRIDSNKNYHPDNCRFVSQAENNRNQKAIRSDNKTGYRGIHYDKRVKTPWYASIQYNGERICLRSFATAKEAAVARNKYITENNLNLPLNNIKDCTS